MNLKHKKLVLLGASTGGPGLIEHIFHKLDRINGNLIIAQHMDRLSLESFSARLDRISSIEVVCANNHKTEVKENVVYVLHDTSKLIERGGVLFIEKEPQKGFYHPTIDELFASAAHLKRDWDISAYILSGIGDDGVKGLQELRSHRPDAKITAQDEDTSKVYGMPRCAKDTGVCNAILSIDEIAVQIKKELL